jgi:hypothetical protein
MSSDFFITKNLIPIYLRNIHPTHNGTFEFLGIEHRAQGKDKDYQENIFGNPGHETFLKITFFLSVDCIRVIKIHPFGI